MARGIENVDGTTLTGEAFSTVIPFGDKFLAISIVLFAFATMVGWAYFWGAHGGISVWRKIGVSLQNGLCTDDSAGVYDDAAPCVGGGDTFNGLMALPI